MRPSFAITTENAGDVAEVVRRLDGLPLAIELAAARIGLLSPQAIARRLDDRLSLLSSGGRDLPERQRTLRGAIDWSYELLGPSERRLFARLSVFAGGGPIDLVERVCLLPGDAGDDLAGTDVVGLLERLAEQSLVRVEEDPHGDVRFTMLETLREYAHERLVELGEAQRLADQHAAAVLELVEAAVADKGDRGAALDRLDEEHDNVRAAIDHAVAVGDTTTASALAFGCWRFWQMRGHLAEGRQRLDAHPRDARAGQPRPSRSRLRALEARRGACLLGRRHGRIRSRCTATPSWRRAGWATTPRSPTPCTTTGSRAGRPRTWRTGAGCSPMTTWRCSTRPSRSGPGSATRMGSRRPCGAWASTMPTARTTSASEDATTRALAIFERDGDHFWIAWTRFTRAFARAIARNVRGSAEDIAVAVREFRDSRDVSGLCLTMSAMSGLLVLAGRPEDAFAVGAAAARAVAETGLHLASLWPTASLAVPDPDQATGALAEAAARGRAWSREHGLDETIRLADELAATAARGSASAPPA